MKEMLLQATQHKNPALFKSAEAMLAEMMI